MGNCQALRFVLRACGRAARATPGRQHLGFVRGCRQCRQHLHYRHWQQARATKPKAPTMATHQVPKGTMPAKQAAAPASPMPTIAAPVAPAAPAKPAHGMPVAVRIGAQYRCAAPHTQARWAAIVAACNANNGVAQVAALQAGLQAGAQAHNYAGPGVPGHFLGYCLRKGYLVPAT